MEYTFSKEYGIFIVNDAKYLKDGALKVELINDSFCYHKTEEDAIEHIKNWHNRSKGDYIVLPVYRVV